MTCLHRLVLPYKSPELSKSLRSQLNELNSKLNVCMQLVFTSAKVNALIRPKPKPSTTDNVISQSKVVYCYQCSCEMSYIGYTNRFLHQRIAEHRRTTSAIQQHCTSTGHDFLESNFRIIARCSSKFDCMIRESHEIYFRKPEINARDEYTCSLLYRLRL